MDIFETDRGRSVLRVDGFADVLAFMEDPNLGNIARIAADHHRFFDISSQQGRDIAQTLEVDTFAVHDPGFGHGQQQVEVIDTFRQSWQPPITDPGLGVASISGCSRW